VTTRFGGAVLFLALWTFACLSQTNQESAVAQVSMCELAKNHANYEGRIVKVRATFIGDLRARLSQRWKIIRLTHQAVGTATSDWFSFYQTIQRLRVASD